MFYSLPWGRGLWDTEKLLHPTLPSTTTGFCQPTFTHGIWYIYVWFLRASSRRSFVPTTVATFVDTYTYKIRDILSDRFVLATNDLTSTWSDWQAFKQIGWVIPRAVLTDTKGKEMIEKIKNKVFLFVFAFFSFFHLRKSSWIEFD